MKALVEFLAQPRTVKDVQAFLKCSKPTAYAKIERLRRQYTVFESRAPGAASAPGPKPARYSVSR